MWYGEGDDMFFIDGEPWPPSLHGTGTEDYFNTSWSPERPRSSIPYFGYARVPRRNQLAVATPTSTASTRRTRCTSSKSLRVSIEHGHDNNLTLDLSSVAYWYQTEPHKTFPPLPESRGAQAHAHDHRRGHPPLAPRVAQGPRQRPTALGGTRGRRIAR